jgi:hypothetical protein
MVGDKRAMRANNQRGFSLLELTIGALLTVGLMGAIFSLVNRNQQVFLSEASTTDMNGNMRMAVDLLTRDVQSAGMGLPRVNGSFSAILYKDGASGAADSILIVNGDPYAPDADVTAYNSGSTQFLSVKPVEVVVTGSGSSTAMTYKQGSTTKNIYQSYANDPKWYICYDDTLAKILKLSANATLDGTGQLDLRYTSGSANFWSPASTFGSTIDTGDPDWPNAKICMLGSLISYRLNTTTHELERTEDLTNWYAVARGILDMQVQYRITSAIDTPTSTPGNRREIRAVLFTITAETADLQPTSKNYRRTVQQFEVTPRNFNLLNNTNLSTNTEATWDF